jgi:propanol-preferring alcohol dehydrogenase
MPKTMRAAIAEQFGRPLMLRELPVPEPDAGQVLVRIVATGVCHTDIHAINGDWPVKPRLPLIPGHEAVGHVAALGSGVASHKEGDRVGISWLNATCGVCEYCLTGRETLCPQQQNTGYSLHGTYADYCLVSAPYALQLPDGDPQQLAPILCAGVTTYKGLKETGAKAGASIVISGVGGIGHLAVQYAKAMGLHVSAIDIDDEKLMQAKVLGADTTINAEREFPANRIIRSTGGAHGALITAVAPKAFEQGIRMLRRGGTCVFVGIPPGTFPLSIFDIVVKGLTVRGSIVGTRQDLREALQFASEGKVSAVVEHHPFNDVNAVIEAVQQRQVKGRAVLNML